MPVIPRHVAPMQSAALEDSALVYPTSMAIPTWAVVRSASLIRTVRETRPASAASAQIHVQEHVELEQLARFATTFQHVVVRPELRATPSSSVPLCNVGFNLGNI